jgi:peptidoglycan hydrolase-like protein with peptidoglycan-binding domain
MKRFLLTLCVVLVPVGAFASDAMTSLHPESAIPDRVENVAPGPHTSLITRVQEQLHVLGFDAGPVNGDWNEKTQAALAQFQLSVPLPASGALDDQTLAALGVERPS